MDPAVQAELDALTAQVTRAATVDDSVIAFVEGVPALIATAVAQATSAGATAEQLQPLVDLGKALDAKSDAIVAAINNVPTSTTPPAGRRT